MLSVRFISFPFRQSFPLILTPINHPATPNHPIDHQSFFPPTLNHSSSTYHLSTDHPPHFLSPTPPHSLPPTHHQKHFCNLLIKTLQPFLNHPQSLFNPLLSISNHSLTIFNPPPIKYQSPPTTIHHLFNNHHPYYVHQHTPTNFHHSPYNPHLPSNLSSI